MSKLTNTILGITTLFVVNGVLTSCNRQIKHGEILGVTYKINPDQSKLKKLSDTLILNVDTTAAHTGAINDTLLVIHQNAYDETESVIAYHMAFCEDIRQDRPKAQLVVEDKIYQFRNIMDFKKMQDSMVKSDAFQAHHPQKRFKVENLHYN